MSLSLLGAVALLGRTFTVGVSAVIGVPVLIIDDIMGEIYRGSCRLGRFLPVYGDKRVREADADFPRDSGRAVGICGGFLGAAAGGQDHSARQDSGQQGSAAVSSCGRVHIFRFLSLSFCNVVTIAGRNIGPVNSFERNGKGISTTPPVTVLIVLRNAEKE